MWNVYSTGTAVPATLYIAVSSLASVAKWGNSGWKVGDRRSCSLERPTQTPKELLCLKGSALSNVLSGSRYLSQIPAAQKNKALLEFD